MGLWCVHLGCPPSAGSTARGIERSPAVGKTHGRRTKRRIGLNFRATVAHTGCGNSHEAEDMASSGVTGPTATRPAAATSATHHRKRLTRPQTIHLARKDGKLVRGGATLSARTSRRKGLRSCHSGRLVRLDKLLTAFHPPYQPSLRMCVEKGINYVAPDLEDLSTYRRNGFWIVMDHVQYCFNAPIFRSLARRARMALSTGLTVKIQDDNI